MSAPLVAQARWPAGSRMLQDPLAVGAPTQHLAGLRSETGRRKLQGDSRAVPPGPRQVLHSRRWVHCALLPRGGRWEGSVAGSSSLKGMLVKIMALSIEAAAGVRGALTIMSEHRSRPPRTMSCGVLASHRGEDAALTSPAALSSSQTGPDVKGQGTSRGRRCNISPHPDC